MSQLAVSWFGLGKSSQQDIEGKSLLEDWNTYSTSTTRDVETGGASMTATTTTSSTTLFSSAQQAGNFLSNSFTTVSKGVSSGVTSAQAALPGMETFSIPTGQQLAHFFAFLAGGGVLLLLAFMLFLPVIILSPSKFALSFTMGCMLIFIGFAQLRGWKQQVTHMFSAERLPFSSAYIGSILATLYAALFMHSYVFCLLCSGLQVVTLLYYLMSYFPGGTQGVKFMLNLFGQAVMSCFGGVQRMLMK